MGMDQQRSVAKQRCQAHVLAQMLLGGCTRVSLPHPSSSRPSFFPLPFPHPSPPLPSPGHPPKRTRRHAHRKLGDVLDGADAGSWSGGDVGGWLRGGRKEDAAQAVKVYLGQLLLEGPPL